jgi:uncharacterized protein YidB (DUF937 family)
VEIATRGVTEGWAMAGTELGPLLARLLGEHDGDGGGRLVGSLLEALGSGGGQSLSGLIQQLQEGGLGAQTRSWVAPGANQPASGPDIAQALPYQTLDHVARQSGLSPEQAADRIARLLPEVVDKLTPSGDVPQGSLEDAVRARL